MLFCKSLNWLELLTSSTAAVLRVHPEGQYGNYARMLKENVSEGAGWMELGCGYHPYPQGPDGDFAEGVLRRACFVVGIDRDVNALAKNICIRNRVAGDACLLPFGSQSFDIVTANMVMQHVAEPIMLFQEVRRCLRPGGLFVFQTTNLWNYQVMISAILPRRIKLRLLWTLEQRGPETIYPTRCRANTLARVSALATQSGFEVITLRTVDSIGMFTRLGPAIMLELMLMKLCEFRVFARFRRNIEVVLRTVMETA